LTLYTRERKPVFRERPELKKAAEAVWKRIIGSADTLRCEQFVVGGASLVAIVESAAEESQSDVVQAVADFRYLCLQEWPGQDYWGTAWRVRPLDTPEKLRDAEELLVQLVVSSRD
jgi:hypothetical protein